jgi:serine/threonine protein phosphatase PrpC
MTRTRLPLQIASLTHPGVARSHNEDNHIADVAAGYVILADGMGGYNAGEVASKMAVAYLSAALGHRLARSIAPSELLRRVIEQANAAIHAAAQTQPGCAGMGTTLVAALFQPGRVTVAHVGDSRMYRLRGGRLEQITRDHSFLQEQVDRRLVSKDEAQFSRHRNLITRALGVESCVEVDVAEHDTMPGDLYLLCSDGLNDMVPEEDIELVLRGPGRRLDGVAGQLVQMANAHGGRDNVTVILARLLAALREQRMLDRLAGWMKQGRGRQRLHDAGGQSA